MDKNFSDSQQNAAIEFAKSLERLDSSDNTSFISIMKQVEEKRNKRPDTIHLEELLKRSEEARKRIARYFE